MAVSLAMLAERELRGEDVPGASDNASGAAVALQLAAECAAAPLEHTEVDVLITSCEESGMLGAQAYARRHKLRAAETTFVNFDTVGGPRAAHLHPARGQCDREPARVADCSSTCSSRSRSAGPSSASSPARTTPGLPTDATPMRARGWEAVTLLAQGDTIPNYHWPTDTYENIDPPTVGRALETGRELLHGLDAAAQARADPATASGRDGSGRLDRRHGARLLRRLDATAPARDAPPLGGRTCRAIRDADVAGHTSVASGRVHAARLGNPCEQEHALRRLARRAAWGVSPWARAPARSARTRPGSRTRPPGGGAPAAPAADVPERSERSMER